MTARKLPFIMARFGDKSGLAYHAHSGTEIRYLFRRFPCWDGGRGGSWFSWPLLIGQLSGKVQSREICFQSHKRCDWFTIASVVRLPWVLSPTRFLQHLLITLRAKSFCSLGPQLPQWLILKNLLLPSTKEFKSCQTGGHKNPFQLSITKLGKEPLNCLRLFHVT